MCSIGVVRGLLVVTLLLLSEHNEQVSIKTSRVRQAPVVAEPHERNL